MANVYLFAYNITLFWLWAWCLYLTVTTVVKGGGPEDVWKAVEVPLEVAQTAAVLEIVHSALGLVRSPLMITAMQVASRLWVLWGIIHPVQGPTTSGRLTLMTLPNGVSLQLSLVTLLSAWSVTEIIRYGFFAVKEVTPPPYILTWLRYSAFLPMYPLGVASELTMAYLAMPSVKASGLWALRMPNKINFAFDYYIACWVIIALYLPGLPQLYFYMLKARKKMLSGGAAAGTKQKAQ